MGNEKEKEMCVVWLACQIQHKHTTEFTGQVEDVVSSGTTHRQHETAVCLFAIRE